MDGELRRLLDGRWGARRDEMRELVLSDPWFAPPVGLTMDEHRDWVVERLQKLADHPDGTSLGFPESVGGGGDIGAFVTGFEMLAMGDLSLLVKVGVQFGLFGGAIHMLGNATHHQEWLPGVIDGSILGCFAMTETGHGSNVQQLETTITHEPETDELVVHTPSRQAEKDYIGNAAVDGQAAVVFGQLVTAGGEHGVHAVIVPIRDGNAGTVLPGVTITDDGPKIGLPGVDNGRIAFDEVRVPRTNLLDRFGTIGDDGVYTSPIESEGRRFFTTIGTLVQGRVSIAGSAISATKVAQTIAVRYGLDRRQFGRPDDDNEVTLLTYRAHQRLLFPRLATTYALHAAQLDTVEMLAEVMGADEPDDEARQQLESRAAGMKALATWHAVDTIQACREACGGAGYLAVNKLAALRNDTDVFATFEGANTVLLQLVAKGLLTDYQADFADLDMLGTVRFVADLATETVVERTAARAIIQSLIDALPGRDGDDDLSLRSTHLQLFKWREEHVLETVAQRLKKGADEGHDPFNVFNAVQDHVLRAARVHVERLVLESFVAFIADVKDDSVRELLDLVADIHCLSTIEQDRAYFMEHNAMSAARSKLVTRMLNQRCLDLLPHARTLIDAFGIPEAMLQAPIAQGLPGSGP